MRAFSIPASRAGILACATASAMLGAPLAAQPLSGLGPQDFNYLEASYASAQPDGDDAIDFSGYEAVISAPLEAGNFSRLRYRRIKPEEGDGERRSVLSGGLGFYSHWSASIAITGLISYQEHRFDGAEDDGYSGELGLRMMLHESFEIGGGGEYLHLDDAGEQVTWFGTALLHVAPGLALSGRYENGEDDTRYTIGLRLLPH